MTHLEQKIYAELTSHQDREKVAEEIAKIAVQLAEKAYNQGVTDCDHWNAGSEEGDFKQFIQDYTGE